MTLIAAAELADAIDGDGEHRATVVCDVRFYLADHDQGRREYDDGHIPGAVFVDLHRELAGDPGAGGGRHPLPPIGDFVALVGRLGIEPSTHVVAYDSAGGAIASRLWWMLRSIGHSLVSVLDGGIAAWVDAGRPLSTDVPTPTPTEYPPVDGWTGAVDADAVAQSASLGGTIVDARSPDRFRGDHEPIDARAGHIPGAINLFHGDNLGPDGRHRTLGELAERFAGAGEAPIVYCGSGVTACHDLLAMSLVGINQARLYAGSWSEWSSDPARPIATGD